MKPIVVTILVMAGVTVLGGYLLTAGDNTVNEEFSNRILTEQQDLHEERAYQYDTDGKAIELQTAGEEKNVLNFEETGRYSVSASNTARQRLDRLIKRSDATFENPIIALNPFGTNANTFYFYFETSSQVMVRYSITVEEESIMDHIRYVNNGQENNLAKTHEFVVSGLIPGRTNYIVMDLFDRTGTKRESRIYKYTVPACQAACKLSVKEGYSKDSATPGMYFVFPEQGKNILCYDSQGILRNITKTETAHGKRFYQSNDCVLYQVSEEKVVKVSALGQVMAAVRIKGFGKIKDFSYDGYKEVYSIHRKKGKDYLLATAMDTGKTRVVYRFPKGVLLSSLSTPQSGSMVMTAAKPSGILVMDGLTSSRPRISYVLGTKKDWKKIIKGKVVEDKEGKTWNTRQALLESSEEEDARYTATIIKQKQVTALSWNMDDAQKRVQIRYRYPFGGSAGNRAQLCDGHMIYVTVTEGTWNEYDKEGKSIREISYSGSVDAVIKRTLSPMCFYGI